MTLRDDRELWDACLDDLEATLSQQRALAAGGDSCPSFSPPPGLGPMPLEVAARARELLEESQRVEELIAVAVAETRAQVEIARRMRAGTRESAPSFVDVAG